MSLADNGIDMLLSDDDILRMLALRWKDRREALEMSVKSKRHAEQQLSYFIGACHSMELCGRTFPRAALMLLSVGQDSVDLWVKERR